MVNAVILCISMILGTSLAAVDTNRRGGHGIFHGLEENGGKTSWLEETKTDSVKITKGHANSLMSNSDSSSKLSSLYLQQEPRGLEYLLDVPDQNPFLANFYRRKRNSDYTELNKVRKVRQINLQPGNVIPGSRGQAVLYGVPSGMGLPTNGYGQQPINNQGYPLGQNQNTGFSQGYPFGGNQNFGVPQGYPSGPNQNIGIPQGVPYPNGGLPQGQHVGGYKTHGY